MRFLLIALILGFTPIVVMAQDAPAAPAAQSLQAPAAVGADQAQSSAPAQASSDTSSDQSQAAPDAAQPAPADSGATDSGQAPAVAPTTAPALPAIKLPPPGLLTLGWSNWNAKGNQQKFLQFGTPPSGFYIDTLRYTEFTKQGNIGEVQLLSPGEADSRATAQLALFGGYTQFQVGANHNEFFKASTDAVAPSERADEDLYIRQRLAHWLSLSSRYSMDQQDDSFNDPDPMSTLHQRTRYNDVVLAGVAGGGAVNLTFSNWAYFDRTQLLDNTNVKRYEASYDHPIGPQDITAQYSYLAVESAGAPSGHVQITSLADDVHVDSSTTASIALRQDTVNLPIVQNSYVRQQQSATATLSHAWENWYGTLAFQRRSAQEINSESTSVTTPQWQTVEANVNGDLGRGWRLIANGRAQNLWNAVPLSTAIPDTLLWSSRQYGQLRLNGVSDFVQGYLDWSYNRTANTSTGTVIQQEVYNAGGDWQASPMVDIYVDYTNDFWAAVDNEVGAPSLGGFAPSDRVLSIGANWIPTSRTSFSAGYSGYWTSNENPLGLPDASTTGGYLTLQVQQQLTHGRRFGVVVAPWAYRDEVASSMDYNATVLRVTLSTPF